MPESAMQSPAGIAARLHELAEDIRRERRDHVTLSAMARALAEEARSLTGAREDLATLSARAAEAVEIASADPVQIVLVMTMDEARTLADLVPASSRPEVGRTGPMPAAIEAMAEHLLEEDHEAGWTWPTHRDDDGYRGNGYVTIAPPDVQSHLRDKARRVLIRAAQIAADPRLATSQPAGRAEVAKWRDDAFEKAAEIVRRYEPFADDAVRDILALRSTQSGATLAQGEVARG